MILSGPRMVGIICRIWEQASRTLVIVQGLRYSNLMSGCMGSNSETLQSAYFYASFRAVHRLPPAQNLVSPDNLLSCAYSYTRFRRAHVLGSFSPFSRTRLKDAHDQKPSTTREGRRYPIPYLSEGSRHQRCINCFSLCQSSWGSDRTLMFGLCFHTGC